MSVDKNNIEELFKSTFEHFESEVDPAVWQQIQSGISSGATSSSGLAGAAGKSVVKSVVKWVAAVGVGGTLAVGSYVYFSEGNESNQVGNNEIHSIEKNETKAPAEVPQEVPEENAEVIPHEQLEDAPKAASPAEDINEPTIAKKSDDRPAGQQTIITEQKDQAPVEEQVVIKPEKTNDSQVSDIATDTENSSTQKTNKALPIAKISASVTKGKLPLEVQFENLGSAGHCSWFIKGTGIQLESSKVQHIFDEAGSFWVILALEDEYHQLVMDSVKITVEADYHIECPKVITPNGDGSNDVWEITAKNLSEIHWYIVNRAGQVVFEWDSLGGFWDGRDKNGNQVPVGSYFYVIEGKTLDGNPIYPEKGVINLFK